MSNEEKKENKEVETLTKIWKLLETLTLEERLRTLQWASQRTIADARKKVEEGARCIKGLKGLPDQLEEKIKEIV